MKTLVSSIAASVALIATASASTLTFYDKGYSVTPTANFSVDGINVNIKAATFSASTYNSTSRTGQGSIDLFGPTNEAKLEISSYGLALRNSPGDDSHQFDGNGWNDLAVFSFDHMVTLTSAFFSFVDYNDDFTLFYGDSLGELQEFSLHNIFNSAPASSAHVALDVVGKVFAIGAYEKYDNFKIKSISFSEYIDVNGAPVPVPGAIVLMATALGGLGVARRRAKA